MEPSVPILDLADRDMVKRTSRRADALGALCRRLLEVGDPDGAFLDAVRPMFQGYDRVERRRVIEALSRALGVERPTMKRYLRAAGVVNEMD